MKLNEAKGLAQGEKLTGRPRHPFYRIHRNYSIYLSLFLHKHSFQANTISIAMILLGIMGIVSIAVIHPVTGIMLVYFSFVLDKCDGEIARLNDNISEMGLYLDEIYHLLINSSFFIAIGLHFFLIKKDITGFFLGFAASYGYSLVKLEHKSTYSINFKLNLINYTQAINSSCLLKEIRYWLMVPVQEDSILIVSIIFILLDKYRLLLFIYAVLFLLILLVSISAKMRELHISSLLKCKKIKKC